MTISAEIRRAAKRHACDGWGCGCHCIHPGETYVRLFGRAHRGDPVGVAKLCRSAGFALAQSDPVVADAFRDERR